jgi:starvation-inducible DNA-binding protein
MVTRKQSIGINVGISDSDRKKDCFWAFFDLLADSYTLYFIFHDPHNFHWNVSGPMFNTLHAMFMTAQCTEQWSALDVIAERMRALEHPAPITYKEFVKRASISEIDKVPNAIDMIKQ